MELAKLFTKENITQAVKFGIVGVINTSLSLAIFSLLYYVFNIDYRISNGISYVIGLANSFVWNKLWTFKTSKNIFRETVLFLIVFAVCYGLQFAVLTFLVEILKMHKLAAQFIGMVFYTGFNFLGNKLLTFKKSK